jgi:hypothetical protein
MKSRPFQQTLRVLVAAMSALLVLGGSVAGASQAPVPSWVPAHQEESYVATYLQDTADYAALGRPTPEDLAKYQPALRPVDPALLDLVYVVASDRDEVRALQARGAEYALEPTEDGTWALVRPDGDR